MDVREQTAAAARRMTAFQVAMEIMRIDREEQAIREQRSAAREWRNVLLEEQARRADEERNAWRRASA